MISKQLFIDRIQYGKHMFSNGDHVYAKPHINPDGSTGGWVAETALVEVTCYIAPTAEVYEYAHVRDTARILGSSIVCGFAKIGGRAIMTDWSTATDHAIIEGSTFIGGSAIICDDSHIDFGNIDHDRFYSGYIQLLAGRKK